MSDLNFIETNSMSIDFKNSSPKSTFFQPFNYFAFAYFKLYSIFKSKSTTFYSPFWMYVFMFATILCDIQSGFFILKSIKMENKEIVYLFTVCQLLLCGWSLLYICHCAKYSLFYRIYSFTQGDDCMKCQMYALQWKQMWQAL